MKFFKIKGGEKRDKRGIFEIFIGGGELLEMKLQTENKISKSILKCFHQLYNK